MTTYVVFTGKAFNKAGESIPRDVLKQMANMSGFIVHDDVDDKTDLLVASRSDTKKAMAASLRGVQVVSYEQFIASLSIPVEVGGK
jgi:NAD-dependent DNA ligase